MKKTLFLLMLSISNSFSNPIIDKKQIQVNLADFPDYIFNVALKGVVKKDGTDALVINAERKRVKAGGGRGVVQISSLRIPIRMTLHNKEVVEYADVFFSLDANTESYFYVSSYKDIQKISLDNRG